MFQEGGDNQLLKLSNVDATGAPDNTGGTWVAGDAGALIETGPTANALGKAISCTDGQIAKYNVTQFKPPL